MISIIVSTAVRLPYRTSVLNLHLSVCKSRHRLTTDVTLITDMSSISSIDHCRYNDVLTTSQFWRSSVLIGLVTHAVTILVSSWSSSSRWVSTTSFNYDVFTHSLLSRSHRHVTIDSDSDQQSQLLDHFESSSHEHVEVDESSYELLL
jgi:hypothetical protein